VPAYGRYRNIAGTHKKPGKGKYTQKETAKLILAFLGYCVDS
jgi:hypothetical protein